MCKLTLLCDLTASVTGEQKDPWDRGEDTTCQGGQGEVRERETK